jgi:hypothetical protein
MTSKTLKWKLGLAGLSLVIATVLTGCGKLGPLDQPAPLFGDKLKADYQAKRNAEAAAKAAKANAQKAPANPNAAADQPDSPVDNTPRTKRDIQDPNQRLTPLSSTPVDGSPNLMGSPVSTQPPN